MSSEVFAIMYRKQEYNSKIQEIHNGKLYATELQATLEFERMEDVSDPDFRKAWMVVPLVLSTLEEYEAQAPINNIMDDSDDDEWKREVAMQAGMGLGIDAYNDAMGYGGRNPEEEES